MNAFHPSLAAVQTAVRLGACVVFSVLLHVLLSWEWTLLAGVAAGVWFLQRGWIFGAAAVGIEWLLVLGYNFAVDARAVGLMTGAMGSILGNLPGFTIVAMTLAIGVALGALGGAVGMQVRRLIPSKRATAHV